MNQAHAMTSKIGEFLKGAFVTRTSGYLDVSVRADLFKEVCQATGGQFSMSHNPGNVLSTLRMEIPFKGCTIILTESDTRPLRLETELSALSEFEMIIGPEDFLSKFQKSLGMREIEVGDPAFDARYFIRGSDPVRVRAMLNDRARNLLLRHEAYAITCETDRKRGVIQLAMVVNRTTDSKESLLELIELQQLLIDQLVDQ